MRSDFVDLGAGALSSMGPHDEFLELCAISASGELTEEEQKKLNDHLAVCASCREALQQYGSLVDQVIPSVAADETHEEIDPGPGWSQTKAEKRLFDRLERESKAGPAPSTSGNGNKTSEFGTHPVPLPSESAWNHAWMLCAAGILLFAALGLFMYRIGIHRGSNLTQTIPPQTKQAITQDETALEAQLSDA